MRFATRLFVCALLLSGGLAEGADRTVCSSGCQYSSVQAAIDAAAPGDRILLRAGQTFTGNYILRNKNTSSTQFITIRSDAGDSNFPPAGVRLIPEGKPGWNTRRSALPRLVGVGGTGKSVPIFRTAAGAHHYRIQFVEIDGLANVGYETLVALGASVGQTSLSQVPHSIAIDRVWLHGHPAKGMKRGIYLNSASTDILNSYFDDFFSFSDSQAIGGTNGPGPYRIINNHLEAAGENLMFGGDDPKILNLVPSDIVVRGNYLSKDLAWRNPILATPSRPAASLSSTTGSLSSGTHYFKVAAVIASGGGHGYSAGSAEVSIAVTSGRSVTLSWPSVAKADKYRIYRGTSSNGQTRYLETTGRQTTFTYTGANERSGTPRTTGTKWTSKNLLELKNAQRVTIDGNVFEYNWAGFQQGFAILFSVRNQSGTAPWSVVRDVTFSNNIVRNVAAGIHILGRDYTHTSQQARNITIRNNVFENLDNEYGNTGRFLSISEAPATVVVNHNTIEHEGTVVDIMAGAVTGFVFTNNMSRHNTYGIKGQATATGNATLNTFFPGAVFRGNVLAGGSASAYPSGNYFPPAAEFLTHFVSAAAGDWRLTSSSRYNNRATDGRDIGADIGELETAQSVGTSDGDTGSGGGDGGGSDDPPANQPPVARAGGPYTATAGTALTVDGSASTDAEAPLVRYDWHFGDDILLRAADVPAANFHGTRFRRVNVSGAAGGVAIENPNAGEAKRVTAYANPTSHVELTFEAGAGVPYRVWLRMRAAGNASANDSLHVQFNRSVNASGTAIHRIGTTASMPVVLEKCDGAGRNGWGWNDGGWCEPGAPVYFQASGRQTMRIQQREDGVMFDQIVISADRYSDRSPGLLKVDTTIVPTTLGADTGITARHTYRRPGTYPVRLWVTDSVGQEATAATTASVGGSSATNDAPDDLAEIVLRAADVPAANFGGTRFQRVSVASAAGGIAIENPDIGEAKRITAYANPRSYVELTFDAAAGVPYWFWIRMRAAGDRAANDSLHVQFNRSVNASGAAIYRIGTTNSMPVVLEQCDGAGRRGWGWHDGGWCDVGAPVYFNTTGTQRLRVQQREDGVMFDQVVLSSDTYAGTAPGDAKDDTTILDDGGI
ncbi:MAG: PKD domain-containing protein [Vicinamibacterales bacterium]